MANFQLRIHQFKSGAVGIYADRKGGNDIIRIHRLTVHTSTGYTNYNTIRNIYPEHASSLLNWFFPHPSTREIKAVATYEEIDHTVEATGLYNPQELPMERIPLEDELKTFI